MTLYHGYDRAGLDGQYNNRLLVPGYAQHFANWKAGSEAQRSLAGKMGARARRPVMVEPEVVRIEDPDLLIAPSMEPSLSDLKSQFWMPTAQ